MGAGKTTIGREVARLTERPYLDTDEEIERRHGPIARIFDERGEPEFRRIEEEVAAAALAQDDPAVISLGGGAVLAERTRARLAAHAFTVSLDVGLEEAWERARESDRPLARDKDEFAVLYFERHDLYEELGPNAAGVEDVLLAGLEIDVWSGALRAYAGVTPRDVPFAVIADERVVRLHPRPFLRGAASLHTVPSGEDAKRVAVVERLWDELAVGRDGVIVGFGGGTTTDVAGFVAATYLRGIRWVAVPTTLVGQVDAAIGGKTGIDLSSGKNLAGAFHLPEQVVIDPEVLATLPEAERRAGMAEVVKTGLLAGRDLSALDDEAMVRGCAAFKAAVVLSDPYERGRRAILNLGHTFAHALETASDYTVRHGDAVALGLLAALRLSGLSTDVVEEVLRPEPVPVDRERARAALKRDKKAAGGRTRLVLLEEPGKPVFPVELPDAEVRRALDALIAD